jgi:hypothetical protein
MAKETMIEVTVIETGITHLMTPQKFYKQFGRAEGKEILAGYADSIVALKLNTPRLVLASDVLMHRDTYSADTVAWAAGVVEAQPETFCLNCGEVTTKLDARKLCKTCEVARG